MQDLDVKLIRLFFMLVFYLVYGLSDLLLLVIMMLQAVLSVFGGGPSQSLKAFGGSLAVYVKQIAAFLTYASEQKPFPFSDWPEHVAEP